MIVMQHPMPADLLRATAERGPQAICATTTIVVKV